MTSIEVSLINVRQYSSPQLNSILLVYILNDVSSSLRII